MRAEQKVHEGGPRGPFAPPERTQTDLVMTPRSGDDSMSLFTSNRPSRGADHEHHS